MFGPAISKDLLYVFGFSITLYGLLIVPFLLILFLTGIALGIIGIAFVLRFGPSAEWFIWPLPAIITASSAALTRLQPAMRR